MQRIVALTCFFLTGLTGLVYEVVWIRRAALAFGSTTFTLCTVLAVFLGGLALGSWWFGRIGQRSDRPLWLYGWLAVAVGLLAAATLPLFGAAEAVYGNLYRALSGEGAALLAVRALLISLIVLPAVTLMGGGLPLFCRQFVAHRDRIAAEVGFLYGLNTLGAAAGAALTGFWLLPVFGMRAAVLAAAVLNITVGIAALRLRMPAPVRTPASEPAATSAPDGGSDDAASTVYLPMYAGITKVPKAYAVGTADFKKFSWESAFWVFNWVSNYAYTRYRDMIKDIRRVQVKLENEFFGAQAELEKKAVALHKVAPLRADALLTAYAKAASERVVSRWRLLGQELLVKYMDGNVRNAEGKVTHPPYPKGWYKRIVAETGNHFLADPNKTGAAVKKTTAKGVAAAKKAQRRANRQGRAKTAAPVAPQKGKGCGCGHAGPTMPVWVVSLLLLGWLTRRRH